MSTLPPRAGSESVVEMTQLLLPGDANALGAAFGGSVMGWIDIAAAVSAQRHARQQVVTASMDELHFHAPIKIGFQVILRARVMAAFRSSMEVGVTVHAEDPLTGERELTTSALLTFVALDRAGSKLPVPPLLQASDDERLAGRAGGAAQSLAQAAGEAMRTLLGVALVAAGTAGFWFGAVPFKHEETVFKLGAIEAKGTVDKVNVPKPLSLGLVVAGTALLVLPGRRKK